MNKLKYIIFLLLIVSVKFSYSQDMDDFLRNFKFSTYLDAYYAFDNDKNIYQDQRLLDLISPYRDQMRLNIAAVTLKYDAEKVRSTLTLHYGDIPDVNWKPVTKHDMLQEANVGFSPCNNLWIDAGYFITHVGAEGVPKDNYFSSFSLPAYVEPYIQSGIRVSYDFSEKFSAALHLINGYNVYEDNNKNKSIGVQLAYAPIEPFKITYNNIIGNEMPAGVDGKLRVFNNLIVGFAPCKKIDILAGFDLCMQEKSKRTDTTESAYTYGSFVSVKYKFNPKFSTSVRGEFFQDMDGILCGSIGSYNWLKGNGITIGCEYKPIESAYVRLEGRYLRLDNEIKAFYKGNERVEGALNIGFVY